MSIILKDGRSFSYDYTDLLEEIEEELAEGVLSMDSKVYVEREDLKGIPYQPIIDWYYMDDPETPKYSEAMTVEKVIKEMKLLDRFF